MLNKLRKLYDRHRLARHYRILARENGFTLPFTPSRDDCIICKEIFHARVYGLAFPFHRKATVIDIGAHKGFFTLFAARNTLQESRIVSLEPSSDNFPILQRVVDANKLSKVTCLKKGIAGKSGEIPLYAGDSANYSIMSEFNVLNFSKRKKVHEKVEVVSLSDLINSVNLSTVDFVKMDCEGAEYEALLNTPQPVFDCIGAIALEYHDLKNPEYTGLTLYKFLKSKGYTILGYTVDESFAPITSGKLTAARLR